MDVTYDTRSISNISCKTKQQKGSFPAVKELLNGKIICLSDFSFTPHMRGNGFRVYGEIKEHLLLSYTFQALLDCGSNPYMCKKLKITYLRKCKDPAEKIKRSFVYDGIFLPKNRDTVQRNRGTYFLGVGSSILF
jgi:hypothetical protein